MSDKVSNDGSESEKTFEINIKTLESKLHKVPVTKDMLISTLKEKIVELTEVPAEQQRLIFRGRVLKDNDPLSEYHVEDGHTLHLVSRRPSTGTTSADTNQSTGTQNNDPSGNGQRNIPNVVLGALNVAGEDDLRDQIVRGVGEILRNLGSGIPSSGGNGTDQNGSQNPNNRGPSMNQVQPGFAVLNHQIQFSQIPPGMPRNMVLPDALTALQDFIHRMETVLRNSNSENNGANQPARPESISLNQRGVFTPQALVSVLEQARQLITGTFASTISNLGQRLEREAGSTDALVRHSIQNEAMRAGITMQHMGAFLLELGRTTMTLRMGQSPEESFVNAGQAIYINSNGPNPIMVQPVPLQTASIIGGPVMSGVAGAFTGEDPSENISIEIHAGNVSGGPNASGQAQPTDPQPIRSMGPTGEILSMIYPVQVRTEVPAGSTDQHPRSSGNDGLGSLFGQISSQLNTMLGGNAASGPTAVQPPETVAPPVNLRTRSLNRQDASRSSGVQTNNPENNQEKKPEQGGSSSDAPASSASETMQSPKVSDTTSAPLGLGLGGLRPTKKTKPSTPSASRPSTDGGSSRPPNMIDQIMRSLLPQSGSGSGSGPNLSRQVSQTALPQGGGDLSSMLSQVMNSSVVNDLLTNMSNQTGVGSPDDFRSMMQQCTQDPAVEGMFADLVGQVDRQRTGTATGPSNGGIDLSGLVQKMMPIVSNVIAGGSGTRSQLPSRGPIPVPVTTTRIGEIPLQRAAARIGGGDDSALNIFTSMVESAGFYDGGDTDIMDLVEELSIDDDLANDYMNVLREEIWRRLQQSGGGNS